MGFRSTQLFLSIFLHVFFFFPFQPKIMTGISACGRLKVIVFGFVLPKRGYLQLFSPDRIWGIEVIISCLWDSWVTIQQQTDSHFHSTWELKEKTSVYLHRAPRLALSLRKTRHDVTLIEPQREERRGKKHSLRYNWTNESIASIAHYNIHNWSSTETWHRSSDCWDGFKSTIFLLHGAYSGTHYISERVEGRSLHAAWERYWSLEQDHLCRWCSPAGMIQTLLWGMSSILCRGTPEPQQWLRADWTPGWLIAGERIRRTTCFPRPFSVRRSGWRRRIGALINVAARYQLSLITSPTTSLELSVHHSSAKQVVTPQWMEPRLFTELHDPRS